MKSPESRYRKLRRQALALAAKGMPGAAARLAGRALRVFDHLSLCKQRFLRCRDLLLLTSRRRRDACCAGCGFRGGVPDMRPDHGA